MTWTCPTCERRYPDSGISVPRADDADTAEGCEVCWVSPAGTGRFVRPDSLDDEKLVTDGGSQLPALDDVLDMELEDYDDRRYVVLFDEDYDDVLIDAEDSVALLVDCDQAVEVLRLCSKVVADLAPEHAPDKEPIDAMIDALQEVRDE